MRRGCQHFDSTGMSQATPTHFSSRCAPQAPQIDTPAVVFWTLVTKQIWCADSECPGERRSCSTSSWQSSGSTVPPPRWSMLRGCCRSVANQRTGCLPARSRLKKQCLSTLLLRGWQPLLTPCRRGGLRRRAARRAATWQCTPWRGSTSAGGRQVREISEPPPASTLKLLPT